MMYNVSYMISFSFKVLFVPILRYSVKIADPTQ